MPDVLDRLKILIDSSTPIIVMETMISWRCPRQPACPRDEATANAIYNSREPAQALSTLESISMEAVFILKDFHRHMDDPVVVRRLRDVGQEFSSNRRTVAITAPALTVPPELASLVEFLELPLPDRTRLREIVDDVWKRVSSSRTLRRNLDSAGMDAVINNLRGLTEEEADRAVSQVIVTQLRTGS
jgi:hypothetical protein